MLLDKRNLVRGATLGVTGITTNLAVAAALQKAIDKVKPDLMQWKESHTNKEMVIQVAKVAGTTLAIALIAGAASAAVTGALDDALWPMPEFDNSSLPIE